NVMNTAASSKSNIDPISENIPVLLKLGGRAVGLDMQMVTAIEALDTAAFIVWSETSEYDKISFLRIQKLIRAHVANYVYVEVGSHLGGTLAPHLADPRCRTVISIDPRPGEQQDVRGRTFAYE